MRTTFFLTMLALAVPTTAQQYKGDFFYSSGSILEQLESGETLQTAAAWGYAAGVHDTMSVLGLLCTPDELKQGQLIRMVMKYAQEHPEEMHRPGTQAVMGPLDVWICEGGAERLGGILLGQADTSEDLH